MNKTIRSNLNVKVAFNSSAKRMASTPNSSIAQSEAISNKLSNPWAILGSTHRFVGAHFSTKFKVLLRPIAKLIFQTAKPLLHPVAFRFRAYILSGLQQRLQHEWASTRMEIRELKRDLAEQTDLFKERIKRLDQLEQDPHAATFRVAVNCGPDVILVQTKAGYLYCPASDYAVVASLIDKGDIDTGMRLAIQNFLKPESVFIDIGAGVGFYTLAAARAMKGRGQIIAFDSSRLTLTLLKQSIQINGFAGMIEINDAAIPNRSGHGTSASHATSARHSPHRPITPTPFAPSMIEIDTVTLDDVVPLNIKVDLIKITVDGSELEVLAGAKHVIAANPSVALIVEFCFSYLQRTGHTTVSWLAELQDFGLVYRVIDEDTGRLEERDIEHWETMASVHLFCARPNSVAWANLERGL